LEVQKHPVQLQADETREAFLQSEDRDREREREREVLPLALRDFSI
jgi:hypothetical protein